MTAPTPTLCPKCQRPMDSLQAFDGYFVADLDNYKSAGKGKKPFSETFFCLPCKTTVYRGDEYDDGGA